MLFNSGTFLIQFLPVVLVGFFLLAGSRLRRFSGAWLTVASLVFYGWWRPENLPLLIASIGFNYLLGGRLIRKPSRPLLIAGIAANVAMLGYFKYTGFLVETINAVSDLNLASPVIVLPLAISFFTFQQIAYLVDANDGEVEEHSFLNYALFITFFPHLIAGPITHHREMLFQFRDPDRFRPRWDLISVGVTLFLIGLAKKVLIADPFGACATPIFDAVPTGEVRLLSAWAGALSYTLQLYFDFSGYSDMAIGLGLMFGISLPINFDSPYKARNIIDYWARWHMTLTRFLTAYIYNPIAIALTRRRARKGLPLPRGGRVTAGTFIYLVALPTMFTLFVSGVWHGAGWQFIIFGLLHGAYLVTAHGWRAWKAHRRLPLDSDNSMKIAGSVLLTFLCVVVALVFFRAPDVRTALDMLGGMAGLNGVTLPTQASRVPGVADAARQLNVGIGQLPLIQPSQIARIVLFLAVVWALPNSNQWLRDYPTALGFNARPSWLERFTPVARWRPTPAFGLMVGVVSIFTLLFALSSVPTEFLYFQF